MKWRLLQMSRNLIVFSVSGLLTIVVVSILFYFNSPELDAEKEHQISFNEVCERFTEYDLTNASDRVQCLKMLQEFLSIAYYSNSSFRTDKVQSDYIKNMTNIINEFRLEGQQ